VPADRLQIREAPVSIMVQHSPDGGEKRLVETALATATTRARASAAGWRLVVQHPSGSLEQAVGSVRRRNLLVSSGILAVLGVSIGFLVVSTRRAQGLARQQMEFVAAVSHELRTPLAVIRSAADNLAEGVVRDEGQVRKYGELVRGEGRRLSEMVEQILELAGIHSGQRGFALAPVPVLPLLRDIMSASSTLVEEAGMAVDYDVPDALPPVLGDEQALRRLFQNLVSNAIKYGAPGGWIGLTARASGREVAVTVADRGIGIEPAEQPRIFEPFYRAPGVISAQINGAGLGLSLVQRIVEAHGGRISVRSAPGHGSEFTIHLPAASGEDVPRTTPVPDPARTSV
jgi:signal transduction histidine kinase